MTNLIFIAVSITVFASFLLLTWYEQKRGMRFFSEKRALLDTEVSRLVFVYTHVDFGSLVRTTFRSVVERVAHDIAHVSLTAIRALERVLTRAVRALRARRAAGAAKDTPSPSAFASSMSHFKRQLRPHMLSQQVSEREVTSH
ncbi:MAG: hypothetical protein WAV21_02630 [Minisyncoccia bacterium]